MSITRAIRRFLSKLNTKGKRWAFFGVLGGIVIIALSIAIYIQFFYKYSATDPFLLGINIGAEKTKEEYAALEANFNSLFNNDFIGEVKKDLEVKKVDNKNKYVFTLYNITAEDETYYSVDIKIPSLNVDTKAAAAINAKIKEEFRNPADSYMRQKNENVIYKVEYAAFVNEHIISIVMKASLKEGENPERIIIKSYNYNMASDKEVTLGELIELKKTDKNTVQKRIDEAIKTAYDNAVIIAEQFGNMYERDLKSDMYKVDSTEVYFLTDTGYIYVVYSYGNNDNTNVVDVIIF